MNPKIFFGELKRRNVYKVAVAYAVVGWLLIQVATQVFPFLEIPNWMIRLVILLTAFGFPVALIIAWAFELTPEGIKRTEDADAARQHSRGVVWIVVVLIAAALSLGLFFLGRYTAGTGTPRQSEAATDVEPAEIDRGVAAGQYQWRSQQRIFFRRSLRGIDRSSCQDSRPQGHRTQLVVSLQRQIRRQQSDRRKTRCRSPNRRQRAQTG